jgi:hypothetical protein
VVLAVHLSVDQTGVVPYHGVRGGGVEVVCCVVRGCGGI